MNISIGDVLLTNTLAVRDQPVKPTLQASFKSPKGESFVVLLLGTTDGKTAFDPDKALNELGWFFQPEKLDKPG